MSTAPALAACFGARLENSMVRSLERYLIPQWRRELFRLWSMRVVGGWSSVGAFILVAPLVSDEAKALVGAWPFAGGLFLASVSFAVAVSSNSREPIMANRLHKSAGALPAWNAGMRGLLWHDILDDKLKIATNTAWVVVGAQTR